MEIVWGLFFFKKREIKSISLNELRLEVTLDLKVVLKEDNILDGILEVFSPNMCNS